MSIRGGAARSRSTPDPAAAGRRDERRGARALVADRAHPPGGQHRRAAVVGEDRRLAVAEREVQRRAARHVLAAPHRTEPARVLALGRRQRGERAIDGGVVAELDEDDRAVRRGEALEESRASS